MKKFTVDSHFVIGSRHIYQNTPCQDHALTGIADTSGFIVVADGCSTGRHTDIGARILTCASTVAYNEIKDGIAQNVSPLELSQLISHRIRVQAETLQHMMGLIKKDLYSTCAYALITENGGFAHILGDGCVILKYRDGTTVTYLCEWLPNRPYYLTYEGHDLETFFFKHKKESEGKDSFTVRKITEKTDTEPVIETESYSAQKAVSGYLITIDKNMIEAGLESVIITSDGIQDFKRNEETIDPLEIVREISSFKTVNGEFVKRRLSRMIASYAKQNIVPDDDIACAAIHIEDSSIHNSKK